MLINSPSSSQSTYPGPNPPNPELNPLRGVWRRTILAWLDATENARNERNWNQTENNFDQKKISVEGQGHKGQCVQMIKLKVAQI